MSLKSGMKSWIGASVVALTVVGSAQAAEVYNKNGVLLNLNGEIQAFGSAVTEDFYTGTERGDTGSEVTWTEGLAKLGLSGEVDITRGWKVFGAVTGIMNGNGGEGDAGGFGMGGDGDVGLFEAYGGIKYESANKGGPSIKLSGGKQAIKIADGFLIGADVSTMGSGFPGAATDEGGTYYLNARKAFNNTVLLNVETGTPIRFDVFHLETGKRQQGHAQVAGGNVEWVDEKWGKLGFMYTRILDSDPAPFQFAARLEDTNMYTIHGATSFGIKDFELAGNFTSQQRDGSGDQEVDAYGWALGATYKFSNARWTPEIMYRYSQFSGDDASTLEREGFDPLFFGSLRWSTWFQGEIAANYSGPFQSNNDVHQVRLTVNPTETLALSAIVNRFELLEDSATVDADYFGTELSLIAEFTVNKNLYISPLYGVLLPGEGYEQTWGKDDDPVHLFQVLAIYTY